MQRIFRVRSTGQWCAPSIFAEGFPDDGSEFAGRVAVALGLTSGALDVVDLRTGEADPRGDSATWLAEPVAVVAPGVVDPGLARLRAILTKDDADVSPAETKEVTLRLARILERRL